MSTKGSLGIFTIVVISILAIALVWQVVSNKKKDIRTDAITDTITIDRDLSVKLTSHPSFYEESVSGMSFKMILLETHLFEMGSNLGVGEDDEHPKHHVFLDYDYYLGEAEVTVAQFKVFIDDTNYRTDADKEGSSYVFNGKDYDKRLGVNWKHDEKGRKRNSNDMNYPVMYVSWNDALAYCEWLSNKTNKPYHLPTEAEWEFAATERGHGVRFGNGQDTLRPREANFNARSDYKESYSETGEYRQKAIIVKSFKPNRLGLYDMTGNLWEWCADWYVLYSPGIEKNPKGPSLGYERVYRGGSWNNVPHVQRVTRRSSGPSTLHNCTIGFRIACSI
jgi:formylglycine-generating enzyme